MEESALEYKIGHSRNKKIAGRRVAVVKPRIKTKVRMLNPFPVLRARYVGGEDESLWSEPCLPEERLNPKDCNQRGIP